VRGRGILTARFGEGDEGLVVAVAHLSLGAQSRLSQLSFIAELLSEHDNAVLMGDFNCLPDSAEMQLLYRRTRLQPPDCVVPTFPAWAPQRAIDHILVTPGLGGCTGHRALPAAASDHLALSIELDVPETALRA
jgi:endonuclease/exonuclease/phosphatase family metal-dependent hydrolase